MQNQPVWSENGTNPAEGKPNTATTGIMQTPEAMILDLAADDYTGLWEFVWGTAADDPEVAAVTRRELLRVTLAKLIADGKVRLYRGTRFTGEETAVSSSDAQELLTKLESWQAPESNAVHLRVLTVE